MSIGIKRTIFSFYSTGDFFRSSSDFAIAGVGSSMCGVFLGYLFEILRVLGSYFVLCHQARANNILLEI